MGGTHQMKWLSPTTRLRSRKAFIAWRQARRELERLKEKRVLLDRKIRHAETRVAETLATLDEEHEKEEEL